MRLGYVIGAERGALDSLLADVAGRLQRDGWRLGGVVQINADRPGRRCDMELVLLDSGQARDAADRLRISQCLGPLSRGCRLDPAGLELAVGLVQAGLRAAPPQLLIINKFGKAELTGRGFRPVIAEALAADVPVLLGVGSGNLDGFMEFAADMAEAVPDRADAILDWCARVAAVET